MVQDAFETIVSPACKSPSFTPTTIVRTSLDLAGAEMMTFLAPASMCFWAVSEVRKNPYTLEQRQCSFLPMEGH